MINQFTLVRLKQVAALLNSFSPTSSIGSFKDSPELQQPNKSRHVPKLSDFFFFF